MVRSGSRVSLDCRAGGHPPPITSWHRQVSYRDTGTVTWDTETVTWDTGTVTWDTGNVTWDTGTVALDTRLNLQYDKRLCQ